MPLRSEVKKPYVLDRTDIEEGRKIGLNVTNPDTLFELATRKWSNESFLPTSTAEDYGAHHG